MPSFFFASRFVVRVLLSVLCLWCGSSVVSSAQTQPSIVWEQIGGLEGRDVYCFTVSGTNIFAGTYGGGVFRSTNNGASWTAVNTGLTNWIVFSLAVSGSTLFAGTQGGGVFRSGDNGASWTAVNTGLTNTQVLSLAVSGSTVFTGTYGGGVFRSTNNGASWIAVNTGLTNSVVWSLAVSGSTLFAGTANEGICRSTDNGVSWTAVNTGYSVWSLAISDSTLFAGTSGGVFRSGNNGTSWTATNTGLMSNTYVTSLAISDSTLFAGTLSRGLYRSDNNGASWTAVNTGLTSRDIRSLAVSGSTIFAGTFAGGVFRATIPTFSPTLTASRSPLNLGTTLSGTAGTLQSYTLTGQNLTTSSVTITAPVGVELAATLTGSFSTTLTLPTVNGSISAVVYARLSSSTPQQVTGSITHRSGFTQTSATVSGTILPPLEPQLSVAASDVPLRFGTIIRGSASPVRSYTLSGANLTAPVMVNAPTGVFLLNSANGQWVSSLTFAPNSTGSLTQTISVRMDSSVVRTLSGGTGANIRHQSGNASADAKIFGTVQDPPSLTVMPDSLQSASLRFGTVRLGSSAAPQQYTLTGSNLLEPVVITAPAGVLLFNATSGTWTNSLTLTPNAGSLTETIRVGIDSSQVRSVNGVILNASTSPLGAIGSAQAIVRVIGNVIPLPNLIATPLQPENLDTIIHFDPSRGGAYTLTGSFLDAPVSLSAPQGILLFDQTSKTWTQALTLQPDAAGSLMQTVSVRLDSSHLGSVRDSIRNVSSSTAASVSVRGAVVPLTLPPGAETTLELRFVGQQPLRIRDTARVQIWLKDSRLLTPRLVGRFLRTLRVTVRIDTNNLAVLGISSLTPRARIESPQRVPADTPLYTILAERPDTVSTGNLLLAEMTVLATLGATTTNTIRIAEPVQWLGGDDSITPTSAVRIVREPESVGVQIRPLFLRRNSAIALVAPNPSSESVQLFYTLSPENGAVTSAVTLTISDAAGRTMKRIELGARQTGVAQQETVWLNDLPTGGYVLMLVTPSETLPWRLDVVR